MSEYVLKRELWIPKPLSEVFPFFAQPENLATLTPPSMKFLVLTPSPVPMAQGALIDYVIRILGVRVRWTSKITRYQTPTADGNAEFIDEQVRGPYRYWIHRHHFMERDGRTFATDEVHYALRFGVLGALAHELYVRHALRHIFDYRATMIKELLG